MNTVIEAVNSVLPPSVSSPLLSPDSASAYLQVLPSTLAEWRMSGRGPSYLRVGRRVYYRQHEIDGWLSTRVFSRTSDEPHAAQIEAA